MFYLPTTVSIADVKAGDRFVAEGKLYWVALDDAEVIDADAPYVRVRIQHHPDKGTGYRTWAPTSTITVERQGDV